MVCFLTLSGLICFFVFSIFMFLSTALLLYLHFLSYTWFCVILFCFHLIYIYYNIFYNKIVSIFFFFSLLSKIKTACTHVYAHTCATVCMCVCVLFAWFCFTVSSFNNSIKCSLFAFALARTLCFDYTG